MLVSKREDLGVYFLLVGLMMNDEVSFLWGLFCLGGSCFMDGMKLLGIHVAGLADTLAK